MYQISLNRLTFVIEGRARCCCELHYLTQYSQNEKNIPNLQWFTLGFVGLGPAVTSLRLSDKSGSEQADNRQ